jgi:hypothetical protein
MRKRSDREREGKKGETEEGGAPGSQGEKQIKLKK